MLPLACRLLGRNSEGPLRLSGATLLGPLPRVGLGLRLIGEHTLTQAACWGGQKGVVAFGI